MPDNKWTRANRTETVLRTRVMQLDQGDLLRPKLEMLGPNDPNEFRARILDGSPIWVVRVVTKAGFEQERSSLSYFMSRSEAEDFANKQEPGSTYEFHTKFVLSEHMFEPAKLSILTKAYLWGSGEPPYGLVYEVLHGAGIYENFNLSDHVKNWLGESGKAWLEEEFGENWECVAIMEYCARHYDVTSMAFIASRILVADFLAKYDFDIGYASRELEVLVGGAEALATNALSAQERRTKASGAHSKNKKTERMEVFMQEIEALREQAEMFSESRILGQAWENAQRRFAGGRVSERTRYSYEVTLRSDEPFRSRHRLVFPAKA